MCLHWFKLSRCCVVWFCICPPHFYIIITTKLSWKPVCPSWFYLKQIHILASVISVSLADINLQHRQLWTVTLKCLKIATQAALDVPRAPLFHVHKLSLPRRQINHLPLLIFPTDLVVWVFLVCLCFFFFFLLIATFLPLMSQNAGRTGSNSIWFHQISWERKVFSFLARETVLAFQTLLLPALCMFYSCSEKLG